VLRAFGELAEFESTIHWSRSSNSSQPISSGRLYQVSCPSECVGGIHIVFPKCHVGSSVVAVLFRPQHNALGTICVPQIYFTSSSYGEPILEYVKFSLKSLSSCYLRPSTQTMASRIYLVKSMSSQVGTVECNVQYHIDSIV
jgi:hypothetical protein